MPLHIYQYVISLIVSLCIRRDTGVIMNVLVQEIGVLKHLLF